MSVCLSTRPPSGIGFYIDSDQVAILKLMQRMKRFSALYGSQIFGEVGRNCAAAQSGQSILHDFLYRQSRNGLSGCQRIHLAMMIVGDHELKPAVEYAQTVRAALHGGAQKIFPVQLH